MSHHAVKPPPPDDPQAPGVLGKVVVLSIFAVAILAAVFAWWWRFTSQREIQEFWGPDAPRIISTAEQVTAWRRATTGPELSPEDRAWLQGTASDGIVDISLAPGLLHARHSLLEKASYDWPRTIAASADPVAWQDGVRFQKGGDTVTLLFDFEAHRVHYVEGNRTGVLIERTSSVWRNYLDRRAFRK
jgi:hypothetical protein